MTTDGVHGQRGSTSIHLDDLPDQTRGVTGVQQFWYIRVKIGGTWSTVYVGNGERR